MVNSTNLVSFVLEPSLIRPTSNYLLIVLLLFSLLSCFIRFALGAWFYSSLRHLRNIMHHKALQLQYKVCSFHPARRPKGYRQSARATLKSKNNTEHKAPVHKLDLPQQNISRGKSHQGQVGKVQEPTPGYPSKLKNHF